MKRMNWNILLNCNRYGVENRESGSDIRRPYQRDFDRIVFSSAFRRLQDKTQVFPIPKSDFVHNRLTHSLEVSSVGRSLGSAGGKIILEKEELKDMEVHPESFGDIVAAACLAHDVGNPPFGHSGEKAIGAYFQQGEGKTHREYLTKKQYAELVNYEGNASGFRILTNHHPMENPGGLFLTYATLGAFSKYPAEVDPGKYGSVKRTSLKKYGYFQSEKDIFQDVAKNLELIADNGDRKAWRRHPLAFLTEAADNICYRIIDLEDGYKLGYVSFRKMEELLLYFLQYPQKDVHGLKKYRRIKDEGEKVGYLRAKAINKLVEQAATVFKNKYEMIITGEFDDELTNYILSSDHFNNTILDQNIQLYNSRKVVEIELAGYKILGGLLEAFAGILVDTKSNYNKKLLELVPSQFRPVNSDSHYQNLMKITDFVARMTDSYAINLYRKITGISIPEIY